MSICEERLRSALNEVARKLKMKKYRIENRDIDETFENYFGVLVPITLIEEIGDGEMPRQLFVKMAQNKKELRDIGVLEYLYEVESFFYMTLLLRYKSLTRIDLSELFVQCYYADTTQFNEVIILKDMREEGFRRYEGNRFLDFDHVLVSLYSLALLHALSMILQSNQENMDTKHLLDAFSSNFPQEFKAYLKKSLNDNVDVFKDTKYAAFFSELVANFDDVADDCAHNAKKLIYGHGDFWKENIMYKYEDNKPVKACVLDFQTIRLLSPAQDVLSFLLTSTKAETRRKYFDFFLETYYDRLRNILFDHSVDPNIIYSRNDFTSDLKTVSSYCFLVANMSFSLWLGVDKKSFLSKHCDEESKDKGGIALYKQIMMEIADDYSTFGYYNA